MKFTVILPLPPKELMPNARPHFMAKANKVKRYRHEAGWSAIKAMTQGGIKYNVAWKAATIQIKWFGKTIRMPDTDNIIACLKSAIDGLRDSEMLADDDQITFLPVIRMKDAKNPRVELEVWETKEKS